MAHDDVVNNWPHTRGSGLAREVGTGVDVDNTLGGLGCAGVDAGDFGVRDRAAQEGHVQRAGELDVVGPVRASGNEAGIFLATDRTTDCSHRFVQGVSHQEPLISAAAWLTAFTMLW